MHHAKDSGYRDVSFHAGLCNAKNMPRKIVLPVQLAKEKGFQAGEPAPDHVTTDGDAAGGILSKARVVEMMASCQQYALRLAPNAIKVMADAMHSSSPRLRLSAATRVCEFAGLLRTGDIEQVLETTAAADQRQAEQQLIFLGSIMRAMLTKSETYKANLSAQFAKDLQDLNDKVQKLATQLPSLKK